MFNARARHSPNFLGGVPPDRKSADFADDDTQLRELLSPYSPSYALRESPEKGLKDHDEIRLLTVLEKVMSFFCEGKYFGDHTRDLQLATCYPSTCYPLLDKDDIDIERYRSSPSYEEIEALITLQQKLTPELPPHKDTYLRQFEAFLSLINQDYIQCRKALRPVCVQFSNMLTKHQGEFKKYPAQYKDAVAECEFFWLLFNYCEIKIKNLGLTNPDEPRYSPSLGK